MFRMEDSIQKLSTSVILLDNYRSPSVVILSGGIVGMLTNLNMVNKRKKPIQHAHMFQLEISCVISASFHEAC